MYSIKHPIGLKQRIAFLGGMERALRLSLLADGYRYLARNVSSSFYLVCFNKKPDYNNGIFLKCGEHSEIVQGEVFRFLKEGDCIDLKTMEITRHIQKPR